MCEIESEPPNTAAPTKRAGKEILSKSKYLVPLKE